MSKDNNYEQWRTRLEPFIISKWEEFRLLGLTSLSVEELWEFMKEKLHKAKVEQRIHKVTEIIMGLSVNDYLNKVRMEMFKETNLFEESRNI